MTLKEKLEKLSILDEEIADLLDDDDAVAEDVEEADEYKQKIYTAISSIDEALAPPILIPAAAHPPTPSGSTRSDPPPTGSDSRVRLPKLTIRSFDGDITKWTSFWDSYSSAIHTNSALSEVDKFNYLRSYLDRTARDAISGLTLTDANYKEAVKSIIAHCVICRRFEGKPFSASLPPPLPKFRVQETRPFAHTAVDFAGPLHVKTFGTTRSSKMWVCLYTCCVTRAVHIDVVPDMSTDTFVRSLKRFCSRRGTPLLLVSDNAKTFKSAAKVIQDIQR